MNQIPGLNNGLQWGTQPGLQVALLTQLTQSTKTGVQTITMKYKLKKDFIVITIG